MKKPVILSLIILIVVLILTSCSNGNATYAGKYINGTHFIELNADGTFIAENYIKLSGKYKINGEEVQFDVQEMNGKKISNQAKGKIKDDKLTGPDSVEYTKESKK